MKQLNKILLLTPLKLEHKLLKQEFEIQGYKTKETQIESNTLTEFEDLPFIIATAGIGKVNYALQCCKIFQGINKLNKFSISGICCLGAAGALDQRLNIGDVIIGLQTIEHDYKSAFQDYKTPSFGAHKFFKDFIKAKVPSLTLNVNEPMDEASNTLSPFTFSEIQDFKSYLGWMASGDEDILTLTRANEIQLITGGAHATAWEGAGGARAAASLEIPYIEIRAISDLCGIDSLQDFKKNLNLCMVNLAHFLIHMA